MARFFCLILLVQVWAIPVAGCLTVTEQPCPAGGSQCPFGSACVNELCEPIGNRGTDLLLMPSLDDSVDFARIRRVVFESYQDDVLDCRYHRDPDDQDRFSELRPNVSAPVTFSRSNGSFGDGTMVRVPGGRHVIFIRALDSSGDDVARGCAARDFYSNGYHLTLWMRLIRADGECRDNVLDYGEQCDLPPETGLCSSDCESNPVALALEEDCITEPTIACTQGDDDVGRCLVGWVVNHDDFDQLVVKSYHLNGVDDPETDRGLVEVATEIRSPILTAHGEYAAVLWRQGDDGLLGATFNRAGQEYARIRIDGDVTNMVASLAAYVYRDEDMRLTAGWLDGNGGVVLEQVETGERWEENLPRAPREDLTAFLQGDYVTAAWTRESGSPPGYDVVYAWTHYIDGSSSESVSIVSDDTVNDQSQPSAVGTEDGMTFFVWTDSRNDLEIGDDSGLGIRGRIFDGGVADDSIQINTTVAGDQSEPFIASSGDWVVVTWTDANTGEIRGRYFSQHGLPLHQPFGEGLDDDFLVNSSGDHVGRPVIATPDLVFFVWLEDSIGCAEGGNRLMMRVLPAPLQ